MTIPKEQIEALKKPLPDLMMATYHENIGWNAAVDHLAAQGRIVPDGWVAMQGWQPIETAPKDEYTKADILTSTGIRFADSIFINGKWTNKFLGISGISIEEFRHKLTHWMPLPEPPKEGE